MDMNKIVKIINKNDNTLRGLLDAVEGIGMKYVMNRPWDLADTYEEGADINNPIDNWDYDGSIVAMTWSGEVMMTRVEKDEYAREWTEPQWSTRVMLWEKTPPPHIPGSNSKVHMDNSNKEGIIIDSEFENIVRMNIEKSLKGD